MGRDRRRGADLVRRTGGVFIGGDVSTRAGIESVVAGVRAETDSIDTLVNNAGVMIPRRTLTEEGMELNFAVHHLAPFTTTSLLMPLLARGAGRVVNTNSEAPRSAVRRRRRPTRLRRPAIAHRYSPYLASSRSKLANLLFTTEFHRRRPGFQTAAVHPGMVRTRLVRSMHSPGFWLLSTATRWMLASPSRGGRPLTELATAPAIDNGGYYNGSRPATPSPHAASRADADRLWQETEKLRGPFPRRLADA